jgi:GNAT superfamily N-acetyltransferase
MLTFRPINLDTDAADLARLYSTTVPDPVTAETIRDWWTPRKDEVRFTMLACDDERAIGYWDVDRETWMRSGHWYVKVIVAPEYRGQGLGTQMYEAVLAVARQQPGATHLETQVREDCPAALRFAQKRGFEIERHAFTSILDLETFDEWEFAPLLERVHDFRFFSLAEAGVTPENKRKLYEVNRASALDNPGNGGVFPDFDSFSLNVFDADWFRADTQILTADGDQWAGISAISVDAERGVSYNAFTGVLREYRGRGLAQALKLQTILLAKRLGMRFIRTDNDSQNAPMLAVNRKLGYQSESGIYRLLSALPVT